MIEGGEWGMFMEKERERITFFKKKGFLFAHVNKKPYLCAEK